jgi:tetratricopeptide (TPR) repeat protein
MEQMERQVAHLPADDPRRREQSLFASVELSLRRLSAANRERVRVLGVFHGGVNLALLQAMMGWEAEEVEGLAMELVDTGLATAKPYNHLALNPALCPFLKTYLYEDELHRLTIGWMAETSAFLSFLVHQYGQDIEIAATLTLLELPNLFALLTLPKWLADPEITVFHANSLYGLLQFVGKPRLLLLVNRACHASATALSEGWSHAHFSARLTRITHQMGRGQVQEALAGARQLLQQAQAAGEQAYDKADYDLAMTFKTLGQALQASGAEEEALPLLKEAGQRFENFANKRPDMNAERMASICLTMEGNCLRDLGRYDAAANAYEEAIGRAERRRDERGVAVGKFELGTIYLENGDYSKALETYQKALELFVHIKEQSSVATIWHQIGIVHQVTDHTELAEDAYNRALGIRVQINDKHGEAATLHQLGTLYNFLKRPEEAVAFYNQAAKIFCAIGDIKKEGSTLSNKAHTLRELQRLEEARDSITRAIICDEAIGHAAEPWKSWDILAGIEKDDGNHTAATAAFKKARFTYLKYRREGGDKYYPEKGLAQSIYEGLSIGDHVEVASFLQKLSTDPGLAGWLPFVTALKAIAAGSRDPYVAEDPGLCYREAAEVLLLIEKLSEVDPRSKSKIGLAKFIHRIFNIIFPRFAHSSPENHSR